MKKTTFLLFSAVFSVLLATGAKAEMQMYSLAYKADNRWVAKEDAAALRTLVKDAKRVAQKKFYVILPENKRNVSVERLVVLRDILERQLGRQVIIEEVEGASSPNQILVKFGK